MRWVREAPQRVGRLAERHPWLFVPVSIVFWTLLSPLALVWAVLWLVDRARTLDRTPAAKRARRVTRLLRWYPPAWRARYGDEMTGLLDDTLADTRGAGLRPTLNVAREGMAERLAPPARREALMGLCLTVCWIPLVPQGLVPAVMKLTSTPTRSWFLALYLPEPFQWPVIAAMIVLGAAMLTAGVILLRSRPTACAGAAHG